MLARFWQGFAGAAAAIVICGSLALGTLSIIEQVGQQTAACHAVNQLRGVLVSLVVRSERSVPTIQYYKQHPDELARVEAQAKSEERQLQPIPC